MNKALASLVMAWLAMAWLGGAVAWGDAGVFERLEELGRQESPAETPSLLGDRFSSVSGGISFRPPGGMESFRRPGAADEIAYFEDDRREWTLKVGRIILRQPVPLRSGRDERGVQTRGLAERTLDQFRMGHPGSQLLRNDLIYLEDDTAVAMMAMRYTQALRRQLAQQAIVQGNDQLYYTFILTTPGAPLNPEGVEEEEADPRELAAVEAFNAMIESVKLMDLGPVRADQEQRLIRTRALLTRWSEQQLNESLIQEQWLRLVRDGKDIGYRYIVEQPQQPNGRVGPNIGIRTRTYRQDEQIDAESWFFSTPDRGHETWSNIAMLTRDGQREDYATELGSSIWRRMDHSTLSHRLNVRYLARQATGDPVERDLPPWYLPHAFAHLLPRLLPLDEPAEYLFATYVSEEREVILRYVDVGVEELVTLDEREVRAIPISDRLRMEGMPTIHYMSPDGRFLGSVTRDPGTGRTFKILPTDAQSLHQLWDDADLTAPPPVEDGG